MDLDGVSAIVTGGASGIGQATTMRLSARGAHCVILDRDASKGAEVAADTGSLACDGDVADPRAVEAAVAAATDMGPLRVLVNAAGIGRPGRTIDRSGEPMPMEDFERVVRVNLFGTFNCARLAAAAMARTDPLSDGHRGSIVNLSSVAAFDGQTGQVPYAASKAAIAGMTLPLARDLAVLGIRVNTIAPGLIDTPIYGSGAEAEAFKARLGKSVLFPLRLGTPDELASMVLELLTNDYMNAETIRVDGGIRMPAKST